MIVSVEVPVIRGGWLVQCVDSVLQQTSSNWVLSLLWDEGDSLSHEILREIEDARHPKIQVHFCKRLGVARARQFLTERSRGELILPLDDDDVLEPSTVARFLTAATELPWASILRGRRRFIDDFGNALEMADWFPFERRHYFRGATLDISNHAHPYAIRRETFMRAGGWRGYDDHEFLGEDCNCFTTMEEVGEIELIDEVLYSYRIHGSRTSLRFSQPSANELWRRIADEAVLRRQSDVQRMNDSPPFRYVPINSSRPTASAIDAVIPFWESNEREVNYGPARPSESTVAGQIDLKADTHFSQTCDPPIGAFHRLELALSATGPLEGVLSLAFFTGVSSFSPALVLTRQLRTTAPYNFRFISLESSNRADQLRFNRLEISFQPSAWCSERSVLHTVKQEGRESALIRFFLPDPEHCRQGLNRCISSLLKSGVPEKSIHVIEKRQSSSRNRNEGFASCSKPWIAFIDDDAELIDPNTLQTLLDTASDLDASLSGPKLLTASGRIYSGVPFLNPLTVEAQVGGMGNVDHGQHDRVAIVPWLPSTVLLVHRSVMLATGGFDELYMGSQHEDADFSLRARARGFNCCYNGLASAIHYNELRNGWASANAEYFTRRWSSRMDLFYGQPKRPYAEPVSLEQYPHTQSQAR
jgi:GT2 family glycosyltransferase